MVPWFSSRQQTSTSTIHTSLPMISASESTSNHYPTSNSTLKLSLRRTWSKFDDFRTVVRVGSLEAILLVVDNDLQHCLHQHVAELSHGVGGLEVVRGSYYPSGSVEPVDAYEKVSCYMHMCVMLLLVLVMSTFSSHLHSNSRR